MSLLLPTTILWKSSNFTQRRVEMRIVTGIFVIAFFFISFTTFAGDENRGIRTPHCRSKSESKTFSDE
jgi:hypothetical protein